jgi:hypothetical protein
VIDNNFLYTKFIFNIINSQRLTVVVLQPKKRICFLLLLTWLFTCLLVLVAASAMSQTASASLPLVKTITGSFTDFTVDVLGNIYLLDKDGRLKKLNAKGDSVAVFNDVRRYGKVHSIDATNPLKVLLFYKDFGTIVTLDRLLQLRNNIDLRRLNFFQVKAICQSFDNGIWIYDELEARLKRIKDDGSTIEQTGDFRLQLEQAPSPSYMTDRDRLVYVYDSTQGLLAFDYYGTLKNKLLFTGWNDFQVIENSIIGRKGNVLERYELNSLMLKELKLPIVLQGVQKMSIGANKMYCLREGSIYIYGL